MDLIIIIITEHVMANEVQMEIVYKLFIFPSYMPSRYEQRQLYLYPEVCQTVTLHLLQLLYTRGGQIPGARLL